MELLNVDALMEQLEELNSWTYHNNAISKEFIFSDFAAAMAFVLRVAFEAEKVDHHPEILLFSYNKVKLTLTTHSKNGVTSRDIRLAKKIDLI